MSVSASSSTNVTSRSDDTERCVSAWGGKSRRGLIDERVKGRRAEAPASWMISCWSGLRSAIGVVVRDGAAESGEVSLKGR